MLAARALAQRRTTPAAIVRAARCRFSRSSWGWALSAARGAYAGLLGRARPDRDPGTRLEHLAAAAAGKLLAAAAARLGRPGTRVERSGRVEREVVAAAEGAGLLILARDGGRARLGPRSLGPASRFIVDHATCPVLLVWPEPAPGVSTIPPPPPHPPHHR